MIEEALDQSFIKFSFESSGLERIDAPGVDEDASGEAIDDAEDKDVECDADAAAGSGITRAEPVLQPQ